MINTPGELRAYMQLIANEHKDINSFFYGNYDDILESERTFVEYPLLWLEDAEIFTEGEDSIRMIYDFSFVVLKNSVGDDHTWELNNHELTFRIALDIIAKMRKDSDSGILGFDISNVRIEPIYTLNNDNDQGWRVSLKIESDIIICYDKKRWKGIFPAGTIQRFIFKHIKKELIFINKTEPAQKWVIEWYYKIDNKEPEYSGENILRIPDRFKSLFVQMRISLDGPDYLYASAYITEPGDGLSVPFVYNPNL